jgi:hypothetical protein
MSEQKTHFMRGLLILLVLGVPCAVAGALAVLAMLNFFISGWLPQNWISDNAADWIWGTGVAGDASNYFKIMVYGGIAYATGQAIRWGFKG